jgi:hypothetical protein
MSGSETPGASGGAAAAAHAGAAWWRGLAVRERRLVALAALVLGG